MDIALIIISSLTLIIIGVFLFLYLSNEKKNKVDRENSINELKQALTTLQLKTQDLATLQNEKFEGLAIVVKSAQDQANSKINSGFEMLQNENLNIQRDVKEKVSDIKTSFKEYSQKVQDALTKYSDETHQSKLEAKRLKEQIQTELHNILKEIKAPLDLD
jgi:SMC interacting uncharacterized protein involved in chromosome segregation